MPIALAGVDLPNPSVAFCEWIERNLPVLLREQEGATASAGGVQPPESGRAP